MLDQLESIYFRFKDIEDQMADPAVVTDQERFGKLGKEYGKLRPVAEVYLAYKNLLSNMETAEEMTKDSDPEMREMAQMELSELKEKRSEMEEEIKVLLIPKDIEDEKDVLVEIRSGTGGDEASIFAGDLFDMYKRYIDSQGWSYEVLD